MRAWQGEERAAAAAAETSAAQCAALEGALREGLCSAAARGAGMPLLEDLLQRWHATSCA